MGKLNQHSLNSLSTISQIYEALVNSQYTAPVTGSYHDREGAMAPGMQYKGWS